MMGPTGSGKSNVGPFAQRDCFTSDPLSQFIRNLLGNGRRPKPPSLKPDTSEIKAYRISYPRVYTPISSLVVVDTPAFDDAMDTDYNLKVLNMLGEWLRRTLVLL